jgi:hypothetical protein
MGLLPYWMVLEEVKYMKILKLLSKSARKTLLILSSAVVNLGVVYFPFPFYVHQIGNKFSDYFMEKRYLKEIIDITEFRINASLFGLIGISLVVLGILVSWLCKREGLQVFWKMGKISAMYSLITLSLIVILIWMDFSYGFDEHWLTLNMGFIFKSETHFLGSLLD